MIDLGQEMQLWGLEGVISREHDREREYTTLVRAIFRSHDGRLPVEQIVTYEGV